MKLRLLGLGSWVVMLLLVGTGCSSPQLGSHSELEGRFTTPELPARCSSVDITEFGEHVITSWGAAPTDAVITPPLLNMTARQFITPHWSGEVMRLRLSNRYSQMPVTLESLFVAEQLSDESAAVVPGSECKLTVGGSSSITIPAGESVVSDPIVYPVRAFQTLGISFFAPTAIPQLTRHMDAGEVPYFSIPGDYSSEPSGEAFVSVPLSLSNNFLLLESLEVAASRAVTTVVAVGDSITDGSGNLAFTLGGLTGNNPAIGNDQRYPDYLALNVLDSELQVSIVNKGISGNKLLSNGTVPQFGPALMGRFDADVLATPGVSHALLMIGTNDLGVGVPPTAQEIIEGYIALIHRANEVGVKLILGTLTPAKGAVTGTLPLGLSESFGVLHGTPAATAAREAINDWIRSQSLSAGVVDFYTCLNDPTNPGYLRPEFNSGDNLHPNSQGYAAMADCVDLMLLQ